MSQNNDIPTAVAIEESTENVEGLSSTDVDANRLPTDEYSIDVFRISIFYTAQPNDGYFLTIEVYNTMNGNKYQRKFYELP